jgi:hypothetical protein
MNGAKYILCCLTIWVFCSNGPGHAQVRSSSPWTLNLPSGCEHDLDDDFIEQYFGPYIDEILAGGERAIQQACQIVYWPVRARCEMWPEEFCFDRYEKLVEDCVQIFIWAQLNCRARR